MRLLLFFILAALTFTLYTYPVLAQDATSNCVITDIGNSNSSSIPANCQNTGNQSSSGNGQVGPSVNTGNAIVDLAGDLINAAQVDCHANTGAEFSATASEQTDKSGVIRDDNPSCLNTDVTAILSSKGLGQNAASTINQIAFSITQGANETDILGQVHKYFQCVGFAQTVLQALYTNVTSGITVGSTHFPPGFSDIGVSYVNGQASPMPQPGDIAELDNFGHVAIVSSVRNNGDGTYYFTVMEANYCFYGWLNNNETTSCRTVGKYIPSDAPGIEAWVRKE